MINGTALAGPHGGLVLNGTDVMGNGTGGLGVSGKPVGESKCWIDVCWFSGAGKMGGGVGWVGSGLGVAVGLMGGGML